MSPQNDEPIDATHSLIAAHATAFPGHDAVSVQNRNGQWLATCPHCSWRAVLEQQGRVPLDPDWPE